MAMMRAMVAMLGLIVAGMVAMPAGAAVIISFSGTLTTEMVVPGPPPVIPTVSGPTFVSGTMTGEWDTGFNAFGPAFCVDCIKASFSGNMLTFTSDGTLPCYCTETISIMFDRDISAGVPALAEANFVSGQYNFASSHAGYGHWVYGPLSSFSVPEPTSWALMIAGFGIVGAAMRRRAAAFSFA